MKYISYAILAVILLSAFSAFAGTRDNTKPLPRLIVVDYDSAATSAFYDFCAAVPAGVFHSGGNVYQAPVIPDTTSLDAYDWFNDAFEGYLDGHGGLQLLTAFGGVDGSVVDGLQSKYGIGDNLTIEYDFDNPVLTSIYVSHEWTSCDKVVICYYNPSPSDDDIESAVNAASIASAFNCPLFYVQDNLAGGVIEDIQRLGATQAYYVGIGGTINGSVKSYIEGLGLTTVQDLTTETEVATFITSRIDEAVICFYDRNDLGQAMSAAYAAASHEGFGAPIPDSFVAKGVYAGYMNELHGPHQFEKLAAPLPYDGTKAGEQGLADDFKAYIADVGAYKNNAVEVVYTFDLKDDGHLDVAFDRAILGDPREPNNHGAIAGRWVNGGDMNLLHANYTSLYRALIYDNPRPDHVTFMGVAYEAGYKLDGGPGQFRDNDNQTHIVNEVIRWSGEECAAEDWKDNNYELHGHNSPNAGSGHHDWNPDGVNNIGFIADIQGGSGFYYNSCHGNQNGIAPVYSDSGISEDVEWGVPYWPAPDERVNKSGPGYSHSDFDDDFDSYNGMIGIFNSCSNGAGNIGQVWSKHLGAACVASYASVSFDGSGRFWCVYINSIVDDRDTMGEGIALANAHTSQVFPQNETSGDSSLRYYLTGDPLMNYYHTTWSEPDIHDLGNPVGGHEIERPLDVTLKYFDAESGNGEITLNWDVNSGGDIRGFNLYRSENAANVGNSSAIGSQIRLNDELITGSGPYSWVDDTVEKGETYQYTLEAIEYEGARHLFGPVSGSSEVIIKRSFALSQNYPNPVTGYTTIGFVLPTPGSVKLDIFDMKGRKVRGLIEGTLEAGEHEVAWDTLDNSGTKVSSGIYVYRLVSGSDSAVKKLVVK
ncbi:MAG: T9SS type A sorting domain-containing protein [bacterium]|nr:T9SS type A sorting domain-containing protein [bacterium]